MMRNVDVAVVGGGPAGLAAAGDLLMLGVMFLKNYLDGRR